MTMRCPTLLCFIIYGLSAFAADCSQLSAQTLIKQHQDYLQHKSTPTTRLKQVLGCAKELTKLNIFTQMNSTAAELAKASSTRYRKQASLSVLDGVLIAVKDNIDVGGMNTTAGTAALKDNLATKSAAVVARLQSLGAIVLAKANMHELAAGVTSNNYFYGPVRNPYDSKKFAGGSSGGSAVAVASHLTGVALGSDTAGSTRIPAALSGVVGFRPTLNRYSTQGVVPASSTLDAIGLFANYVEDIQILDAVLSNQSTLSHLPYSKPIRLGLPDTFFQNLDEDTKKVVDRFIKKLRDNHISLIKLESKNLNALVSETAFPILMYELKKEFSAYLAQRRSPITLEQLSEQIASPDVKALFQSIVKNKSDHDAYQRAIKIYRPKLQMALHSLMVSNKVDALIFPTTKLPARDIIGSLNKVKVNNNTVDTVTAYTFNTIIGANAGIPGISVPIGKTDKGLPVGIELDGPAKSDRALLQIARVIESIAK